MKEIFGIFKKSLYDPEFYRKVSMGSFKDAFLYYIKLIAFFTVVLTAVLSISVIPQAVRFLREQAFPLIKEYYPADLVVSIEKGEARTVAPEPYIVPLNKDTSKIFKESNFDNLIVIDTQSVFNKEKFDTYKTFALLTKTDLVTKDDHNRTTIQNLRGFPDVVVSQETLISFTERVSDMLVYIIPAGTVAVFLAIFSSYFFYLVPLLLFALIPFILARIKNTPISYMGAYKMSIYAGIPGLALKTFLNMTGFFFVPAYLSFLVFVLIIVFNMKEEDQ